MAETKRVKNAQADVPDFRDWIYKPTLYPVTKKIDPPFQDSLHILDQKSEGACTGFALAAAINFTYQKMEEPTRVSARMLYEMAKRNDEWPGEEYDGSSLRGVIEGWKNMGVCRDEDWKYSIRNKGDLTIARAKQARNQTIGSYYRLKPSKTDFHSALNETGVIIASANVHKGWDKPRDGLIKKHATTNGGHAFAIIGYNDQGFWVQNSWGKSWGKNGLALWTYEDWIENVMDAWVFQISLPTPQIFGLQPNSSVLAKTSENKKIEKPSTPRAQIAGHFVHVDDGKYKTSGRYWSTSDDVQQTAALVANNKKYNHIVMYVHGGLNSPKASARRIAAMKEVFKDNEIYPFHIMYDTGLVEELKDLIFRKEKLAENRVGGISEWRDRFIEGLVRRPGTLLWEEMKRDAEVAFASKGAASDAFMHFKREIKKSKKRIKIHLVGHSTGAVVIAHLLKTFKQHSLKFNTCTLLAPACSIDLYNEAYIPALKTGSKLKISDLSIYNLKDKLELDDKVTALYQKSLLYLVSNAFEREISKPLLGMEKFSADLHSTRKNPSFIYSNGVEGTRSKSTSHGGFDNDTFTMNHILRRMLGKAPSRAFTKEDLDY
ncbi:MAG: C1 family peptidase [Gammaproteobacteria bacterium]